MENDTEEKQVVLKPVAENMVKNFVLGSMGVGFIPIPIVDFLAVGGLQLGMLKKLSTLYGAEFSKSRAKNFISALVGSITPLIFAGPAASLIKLIPVVGWGLGAASMPIVSGASTYALGKVFVKHFESGGTFLNFEPGRMKKYYKEKFEEGKTVATDLKKEAAENPA